MNLPKISSAFGSLFLLLWFSSPLSAVFSPPPPVDLLLPPSDAVSLLTFKSKADLDNKLLYALHERFDYCEWQGVKCAQGRVVRFSLQGYGLRGTFSPDSLTRLEQLRVLSLRNNSLFGPIPNLSRLVNLKSLLLGRNFFSGSFPPSVLSLYKLRLLDLAFNNLTGPIPVQINRVDRLNCLNLEFNRFNGSLPPLNQSDLSIFNVSGNNFTGPIPNTSTLTQFQASAFSLNPYLCGEIIDKPCDSPSPFFKSSSSNNTSPTTATGSSNSSNSQSVIPSPSPRKHQRTALILGFSFGTLTLVSSLFLCLFATMRNHRMKAGLEKTIAEGETVRSNQLFDPETITVRLDSQSNELTEKCEKKRSTGAEKLTREKSGELAFCVGEEKLYTLEHLMRASAEMLGRGIMGATYKAKLDNRMTLTVKRIDGGKFCAVDGDTFERHMEMVGALRHPNLVPVRAYFQAKGERLIIYDYQPNGSVFNLIHGSRSARAKPLHWTSCLKIAEDVAQGLAYIHQASNFIHGNLKSSNVLLGADFEACVTDYCIATLADTSSDNEPDSVRYRAPELRKSSSQATAKSDVYAFGVLLLEVLSGKPPSLHPFLAPPDMPDWVRAMRGEDFSETDRLGMLVEVASVCSLTSPEQRPSMWHVLKMIQKIKSSLVTENLFDQSTRFP